MFQYILPSYLQALEQYGITSGDSALLVNGITMDVDTVDMFSLYDTIKNDLKIMDELSQHGLAVSNQSKFELKVA